MTGYLFTKQIFEECVIKPSLMVSNQGKRKAALNAQKEKVTVSRRGALPSCRVSITITPPPQAQTGTGIQRDKGCAVWLLLSSSFPVPSHGASWSTAIHTLFDLWFSEFHSFLNNYFLAIGFVPSTHLDAEMHQWRTQMKLPVFMALAVG